MHSSSTLKTYAPCNLFTGSALGNIIPSIEVKPCGEHDGITALLAINKRDPIYLSHPSYPNIAQSKGVCGIRFPELQTYQIIGNLKTWLPRAPPMYVRPTEDPPHPHIRSDGSLYTLLPAAIIGPDGQNDVQYTIITIAPRYEVRGSICGISSVSKMAITENHWGRAKYKRRTTTSG